MQDRVGKVHRALQEFSAEGIKGDIAAGENEHEAQSEEIHQIDHHHREKRSVLDEISLPVPEHPNGERYVKHPGKTNQPKEPSMERGQVPEHADAAVKSKGNQAVNRKKIGRERDPEIVSIDDNMSAFATHPETSDAAPHDPDPKHMGKLMTEDAHEHWLR